MAPDEMKNLGYTEEPKEGSTGAGTSPASGGDKGK